MSEILSGATITITENNAGRGLQPRPERLKTLATYTACRKRLFSLALEKPYSGLHDG